VSDAYGGSTSDRQICERSDLIGKHLFNDGDSIMADRGFDVQDLFATKNVHVNIPSFLKGKRQLTASEVVKDRRIVKTTFIRHGKHFTLSSASKTITAVSTLGMLPRPPLLTCKLYVPFY